MDIIANYLIARNNSGFVEGFNNKVNVRKKGSVHLWPDIIQFNAKTQEPLS